MSVAKFSISLSFPSPVPVTAQWSTRDGTAVAGVDYVRTTGTLSFAPGEVSKEVEVELLESGAGEARFFGIELTNVSNATTSPGQGGGGSTTIMPPAVVRGPPGEPAPGSS